MPDKKIIIINSKPSAAEPLKRLWNDFPDQGCALRESQELEKNFFLTWDLNSRFKANVFLLLLPGLRLAGFFRLFFLKKKSGAKNIALINWNEKLIFTPAAARLKMKVFWIELPENNYNHKSSLFKRLYLKNLNKASIYSFLSLTDENLRRLGFKNEVRRLLARNDSEQNLRQDNIFSTLAKADKPSYGKKHTTIGLISDFKNSDQLENIFKAVKNTLEIVPIIQLILLGDGPERKNFSWLAKKIGLESITWFVGEQKYLKKWLDGFDIYLEPSECLNLTKLKYFLSAMENGLPTIGFKKSGLEDFVGEESPLLVESGQVEDLSARLIDLSQNSRLQKNLGEENRQRLAKIREADSTRDLLSELL